MSKREKILVGLMLLSVVYGAYVWIIPSPQRAAPLKTENQQQALKAFIVKIAEKTTTGLSKNMAYALKKAEAKWERDPLVHIEPKKAEAQVDSQPLELPSKTTYTGFLRMGDRRLAIINGMEYEAGDRLEPSGFIIQSISPSRVVIAAPGNKKKTINLPMEETE